MVKILNYGIAYFMRRFCITYKSIYSSLTLPIKMLAKNFFHFEWKKKNHKSIKMYAFFCVNSNASTTTYLKTKHTMEFVGFLFQIIIRNPLKRAPFRWFGVLNLGRKAKQSKMRVSEWENLLIWCPIKYTSIIIFIWNYRALKSN